jgi:uncharacterized protein (DUF305 family)
MKRRWSYVIPAALVLGALSACGQTPAATPGVTQTPAAMDHGAMSPAADAPIDVLFIDSMIVHHEGAISMAEQALQESERPEIRELAENVIAAQQPEIDQMRAWRDQWYPGLDATAGMDMPMGDMEVSGDASQPFDLRFIDAMIAHHRGAIDMARMAQEQSQRPEITELAAAIISAQEAEIAQLEQWRGAWFGR